MKDRQQSEIDQIATLFDAKAKDSKLSADTTKNDRHRAIYRARQGAWETAAYVLRNPHLANVKPHA